MATNDSTALVIPGQVNPFFCIKRGQKCLFIAMTRMSMLKTMVLQVLSPAEQNAANMAKLEQQVTKLLDCS